MALMPPRRRRPLLEAIEGGINAIEGGINASEARPRFSSADIAATRSKLDAVGGRHPAIRGALTPIALALIAIRGRAYAGDGAHEGVGGALHARSSGSAGEVVPGSS